MQQFDLKYFPYIVSGIIILLLLIRIALLRAAREKQYKPIDKYPFRPRNLLTRAEYSFFMQLSQSLGNDILYCPKVRLEDLCYVEGGTKNPLRYRGYIRSRHVDFVLCDRAMHVLLAIELDDSSHQDYTERQIDDFKDNLFRTIGIPLIRVRTKRDYTGDIQAIRHQLRKRY